MMYADKIMLARIFMGHGCAGKHECVACGLADRADKPLKRTLKSNFVNFDELMVVKSDFICESCEALMTDPDMRFRAIYYPEAENKLIPERSEVLKIISNPTNQWVLSLPYSNKKHHWLYAGLSDTQRAYIGTDNRTIVIDYQKYDIPGTIDLISMLISGGIPRSEIISGSYSLATRYNMPDIMQYDERLAPLRPCGAIELFVKYTPAVKEKIELPKGCVPMITETEQKAGEILYGIAARSQYRIENGLSFWGGFFERRINRLKNLPLHEFVSRLSDAVGAATIHVDGLAGIENDEAIMNEIRKKTKLVLSIAYDLNKEVKK